MRASPTSCGSGSRASGARRRLYTLLTRAKSELILLVDGGPTTLLAAAIEQGLLDVATAAAVPAFVADDDDPL